MEKEFLVNFCERKQIVTVAYDENIYECIKRQFGFEAEFVLQNFDKEWDEWLDVFNVEDIPNRTVLKCVFSRPLESDISTPGLCSSRDIPISQSDSTDILSDHESSSSGEILVGHSMKRKKYHLEIDCDKKSDSEPETNIASPSITQYLRNKWPNNFSIDERSFSKCLHHALNTEKPLNWSQKRELLEVIFARIQSYTEYPSKLQRHQVAVELVSKYPYLKETLGSGTVVGKNSSKIR